MMSVSSSRLLLSFAVLAAALSVMVAAPAFAQREASFVPPSQMSKNRDSDEIIAATPKVVEVGESIVGITKHLTLFFTNFGSQATKIENMSLSADSNVRAEMTTNDCEKIGTIKPNDRCAIGLEITPISPGTWTAEIVMVHNALGRVSRATVTGKSAGETGSAGQQPGLSLVGANKDQQIDFGEVESGAGRAVRSVLLANDSPQVLQIKAIDLVGADRGLSLMGKGGCVEGQDVPPGGSCPVTVIWQPQGRGDVSTDLIIQHTGPVGFAVIPVRGKVTGAPEGSGNDRRSANYNGNSGSNVAVASPVVSSGSGDTRAESAAASLPIPKSGKSKGGIPPISASSLYGSGSYGGGDSGAGVPYTLRGTVGTRAILAGGDGAMVVAGVGDVLTADDGAVYRILNVEPTRVTMDAGGYQAELILQSPSSSFGGANSSKATGSGSTKPSKSTSGTKG